MVAVGYSYAFQAYIFYFFLWRKLIPKINHQQQLSALYIFGRGCIATASGLSSFFLKFTTVRVTGQINYVCCYLLSLIYFGIHIWKKWDVSKNPFHSLKKIDSYHTKYKIKCILD